MKSPYSSSLPPAAKGAGEKRPPPRSLRTLRTVRTLGLYCYTLWRGRGRGRRLQPLGGGRRRKGCVCVWGGLFSPDPSQKRFLFSRERPEGEGMRFSLSFFFFCETSDFFPFSSLLSGSGILLGGEKAKVERGRFCAHGSIGFTSIARCPRLEKRSL